MPWELGLIVMNSTAVPCTLPPTPPHPHPTPTPISCHSVLPFLQVLFILLLNCMIRLACKNFKVTVCVPPVLGASKGFNF